jgi:hypothetical protein
METHVVAHENEVEREREAALTHKLLQEGKEVTQLNMYTLRISLSWPPPRGGATAQISLTVIKVTQITLLCFFYILLSLIIHIHALDLSVSADGLPTHFKYFSSETNQLILRTHR